MADSVTVDSGVEALRRAASPPARPVTRRAASPVHRRAASPVYRRAASPVHLHAPAGRGLTFEEREALRRGQLPRATASPPRDMWGGQQEPGRWLLLHLAPCHMHRPTVIGPWPLSLSLHGPDDMFLTGREDVSKRRYLCVPAGMASGRHRQALWDPAEPPPSHATQS